MLYSMVSIQRLFRTIKQFPHFSLKFEEILLKTVSLQQK